MTRDGWRTVFLVAALVNLGNGLWMLAAPYHWYMNLPAAVPDFGPYNEHFVRDIGATFTTLGVLLLWGSAVPAVRLPTLVAATLFSGLHALVHVYDGARGFVGPEHWLIDLPGVYVPTLLLVALTLVLARQGSRA